MSSLSISLILSSLVFSSASAIAQTVPTEAGSKVGSTNEPVSPDNTKSNKEDPSNTTRTADSQPNNATDMGITQQIRRSVMSDKSLSAYGHNVKIVTTSGKVTLNGVVHSDQEKADIGAKAAAIVGREHVENELKVTTAH